MKFGKKTIGVLAGAVTVAAFALTLAFALPQTASAHGGPGGRGGPGMAGGVSDTYLAEALGITAAELQTAQQEAAEEALSQAVEKGLITQTQADALKARGFTGRGGFGMHLRGLDTSEIDSEALLAAALGVSVDELNAAQTKARETALAQAVTDGRITQEQADMMKAQESLNTYLEDQGLDSQIRSLYEKAIQGAVSAGVITQSQADTILENLSSRFGLRGGFKMPGFGGHDMGGRGRLAPDAETQNTTPSTPSQTPMRFSF